MLPRIGATIAPKPTNATTTRKTKRKLILWYLSSIRLTHLTTARELLGHYPYQAATSLASTSSGTKSNARLHPSQTVSFSVGRLLLCRCNWLSRCSLRRSLLRRCSSSRDCLLGETFFLRPRRLLDELQTAVVEIARRDQRGVVRWVPSIRCRRGCANRPRLLQVLLLVDSALFLTPSMQPYQQQPERPCPYQASTAEVANDNQPAKDRAAFRVMSSRPSLGGFIVHASDASDHC